MKIGILGGSFNPPHLVHKQIAEYLIKNNYLDKVIYVPTGDKYNKKYLVSSLDRYNMVKEMIKDNSKLEVSGYELNNELVYTYQTLDHFKECCNNDEIYFICGADNIMEFNTWKNYQYILDNYKILVINRNNIDFKNVIKHKNVIDTKITINNLSSTLIRNNIKSIEITKMLDNNVYHYIIEKKLYI